MEDMGEERGERRGGKVWWTRTSEQGEIPYYAAHGETRQAGK